MPHKIRLARERYTGLHARGRSDRSALWKLVVYAVLAISIVGGLGLLQRHWQVVRELSWNSVNGSVEDVRPVLVSKIDSKFGGAMLYQVQVLARYTVDGASRLQWITVSQRPEVLVDAQFQAFHWKGQRCIVRWNPSDTTQAVVEMN